MQLTSGKFYIESAEREQTAARDNNDNNDRPSVSHFKDPTKGLLRDILPHVIVTFLAASGSATFSDAPTRNGRSVLYRR